MTETNRTFDAIVIGSGIGGLAAAACLARVANKRVLVLEKHYEIGGLTHMFSRGRYKWDVGLHYVGRMRPGLLPRKLFDFITGGKAGWKKMPDRFERIVIDNEQVDIPAGERAFRTMLLREFPEGRRQIRQYFRDVKRAVRWHARLFLSGILPRPAAALLKAINVYGRRLSLMTLEQWCSRNKVDGRLRDVLCARWGDYGSLAHETAFVAHAVVMRHYFDGAWYPESSPSGIAAAAEQVIEHAGGMVLVNRDVQHICTYNGQVTGVRVLNTSVDPGTVEQFDAPVVLSSAGYENTLGPLMRNDTGIFRKPYAHRNLGYSAVSLYLGLRESPEKLGVHGENIWIAGRDSGADIDTLTDAVIRGVPHNCYVSFPSLRGNGHRGHTAEIVAIVKHEPFLKMFGARPDASNNTYAECKLTIGAGLLALADRHIPGLASLVDYAEVSTPLTMVRFGGRGAGSMYGARPDPSRFSRGWLTPRTGVKGLFLAGSDVCLMGVAGALMGGVAAASAVMGGLGLVRIVRMARKNSARHGKRSVGSRPLAALNDQRNLIAGGGKIAARLADKKQLTKSVFELTYELPRTVGFMPGQFARIQYDSTSFGAYSISGMDGSRVRFVIDMKYGGQYSEYFARLRPGQHSAIRMPLGEFRLHTTGRPKVFFTTGTGITPFLAMFEQLAQQQFEHELALYFGCRTANDNFIDTYLPEASSNLNLRTRVCVSKEPGRGHHHGRVTDMLPGLNGAVRTSDFYISGHPGMVRDVSRYLHQHGARNVFCENY